MKKNDPPRSITNYHFILPFLSQTLYVGQQVPLHHRKCVAEGGHFPEHLTLLHEPAQT